MKLEIVFKNGKKRTFYSVESFSAKEEFCLPIAEGKLFEVNPLKIDRSKFKISVSKPMHKWVLRTINEAFLEVDKHPEKYSSPFYTLIPEKKWAGFKYVDELIEYANDLGGYMADWVEQALEWAQRISNGESLEDLCDAPDTANYYRIFFWKNNYVRRVGGSRACGDDNSATAINISDTHCITYVDRTVPLVVIKKK